MAYNNLPNFDTNQKTVTTSGTPVQLPAMSVPQGLMLTIRAKLANTGDIFVGPSSAKALKTSNQNLVLSAGESIQLKISDANLAWIDAAVNGEGIELVVEQDK
ncbi:hypothetical protein MYX07_00370 [Patescibacteria group bacterium AH-259-L07]|nr:hypothetical protein [Patescibacteria group bacterium AH-259-L07]